MRVAIDCRLWNEGGVGRYIRNLVSNLANLDRENEYTLIFYKDLENLKFKIFNLKLISNLKFKIVNCKWHSLEEQLKFGKELDNGHYDLVHFPYFSHPLLYSQPFVITIHDLTILKFATGKATTKNPFIYYLKRWGYQKVLEHGIYRSKKIIVPSEFVKKDILENFSVPSEKIVVTYEGMGEELILNLKFKILNSKEERENFFLYVGNFYPHKNVEFLVRAWQKIDQELILAGPNDFFAKRIKALIKKVNLEKKIKFVFNPSDEQLASLYQKAKALILPSLFEGFGLPVVEATYFNCPLFLSDIPVFREIAPSGTVFFKANNESDLVSKIQNLSTNTEEYRIMNKEYRGEYFAKFSFAKMAEETLKIYKKLLSF